MRKRIPVGIKDYEKLKRENYYVVDKTLMINGGNFTPILPVFSKIEINSLIINQISVKIPNSVPVL